LSSFSYLLPPFLFLSGYLKQSKRVKKKQQQYNSSLRLPQPNHTTSFNTIFVFKQRNNNQQQQQSHNNNNSIQPMELKTLEIIYALEHSRAMYLKSQKRNRREERGSDDKPLFSAQLFIALRESTATADEDEEFQEDFLAGLEQPSLIQVRRELFVV